MSGSDKHFINPTTAHIQKCLDKDLTRFLKERGLYTDFLFNLYEYSTMFPEKFLSSTKWMDKIAIINKSFCWSLSSHPKNVVDRGMFWAEINIEWHNICRRNNGTEKTMQQP